MNELLTNIAAARLLEVQCFQQLFRIFTEMEMGSAIYTSDFSPASRVAKGVVSTSISAAMAMPWLVTKASAVVTGFGKRHNVKLSDMYHDLWTLWVLSKRVDLTCYDSFLQSVAGMMHIAVDRGAPYKELEDSIVDGLDRIPRCPKDVTQATPEWEAIFSEENGNVLSQVRRQSRTLVARMLNVVREVGACRGAMKTLHLVGVGGMLNAGKTTLVQALLGPNVVKVSAGNEHAARTILPTYYSLPGCPEVGFIDLPGLDDFEDLQRRAHDVLDIVDIKVLLIPSISARQPSGRMLLDRTPEPCELKLVTKADELLRTQGKLDVESAKQRLKDEREDLKFLGNTEFAFFLDADDLPRRNGDVLQEVLLDDGVAKGPAHVAAWICRAASEHLQLSADASQRLRRSFACLPENVFART
jgi:hypothetical protein